MERDILYCKTEDGASIAYSVDGAGTPLLVCPHFIESFALDHMVPPYEHFMDRLGQRRQLIRFDMRGTGLSDRDVTDFSVVALRRDLEAVVTASGAHKIDIWAPLFSVTRAIAYVVRYPQRVRSLVLYQAHHDGADAMRHMAATGLVALARADWRAAAHAIAGSGRLPRAFAETAHAIGEWNRKSASGETFASLIGAMAETEIVELLPLIAVPTFLIHHSRDRVVSIDVARKVAAAIPASRMRVLEGDAPFWVTEDTARETAEAVDSFLPPVDAPQPEALPASPFRTVLFTDIVDHTEMMQRLGDARGRDVLREHERITRDTLKAHGGTEVKTMGDGFMASFGSVAQAMECAIALQRAFAARNDGGGEPLSIRVGLNAGEPIEEEGDLFGATVIMASRVCAQAGAGEILIPEPVRHLLAGKPYVYADRGETMLKGFEDAVRIFEVRWRD
jgi:class 3 adenylate cyclase